MQTTGSASVDPRELDQFERLGDQWWSEKGPMRPAAPHEPRARALDARRHDRPFRRPRRERARPRLAALAGGPLDPRHRLRRRHPVGAALAPRRRRARRRSRARQHRHRPRPCGGDRRARAISRHHGRGPRRGGRALRRRLRDGSGGARRRSGRVHRHRLLHGEAGRPLLLPRRSTAPPRASRSPSSARNTSCAGSRPARINGRSSSRRTNSRTQSSPRASTSTRSRASATIRCATAGTPRAIST